ncbi:MAG: TonB-dependent receptor plug domain-containing protein, partial [Prevotellaceae bacterium]|nr:TonB-dependent receptor plug domain-containing protein [Prevotellaceae bacterium]
MKQINRICLFLISGVLTLPVSAQTELRDSLLPEVSVTARRQTDRVRSAVPLQSLSAEELRRMPSFQVSDAVKHFAGVTVKDYGGVGGLKTVSLRSLGAQHTAVSYDGIGVSDAQTGQIDIGRFSLDNVERLTLSSGQSNDIFRPARQLAAAGVLDIQTSKPVFAGEKHTNARAAVKGGSWGLFNPALRLEQRIGKRWAATLDGEWTQSDGHYPYMLRYGGQSDSTSHERRTNTAVRAVRAEAGLYADLSESEHWRTKAYFYRSSRGLPSATTYYNTESSQHLWEQNLFVQTHYTKDWDSRRAFQASAKWNESRQRYLDPDFRNAQGRTESRYRQQEYYLTASFLYRPVTRVSLVLSGDGSMQTLHTEANGFAAPHRYTALAALAGKYADEHLTTTASLIGTWVREETELADVGGTYRRLSPYVGFTIKPLTDVDLRIRAFHQRTFRLPTFNDLYYERVGNTGLRPERAAQTNVGMTYERAHLSFVRSFSLTIDAYYNRVTDKIVAVPTKNIFVWSTVNLGKIDIRGMDLTVQAVVPMGANTELQLSGNYTYQRALDVTNSNDKTYRQQISYTPRVSGSGQVAWVTRYGTLSYAVVHSGKRYVLGENLPENRLEAYTEHNLAARRTFDIG